MKLNKNEQTELEVQTSLNAYISMLKMARHLLAGEVVDDANLRFWADE